MVVREKLTKKGRRYAWKRMPESIVARVALTGYVGDWPEEFVDAAIRCMNRET